MSASSASAPTGSGANAAPPPAVISIPIRIPSGLLRGAPHDADQLPQPVVVALAGEEAVADPPGTSSGHVAVPAHDDRNPARMGTGPRDRVGERHGVAVIAGRHVVPERPHGGDVLLGAGAAPGEGDADDVELLFEPAHADTESQSALREHVEGGAGLGEHHGIPFGKDQDSRADVERRGVCRGPGQPHDRIGDRGGLTAGHAAGFAVGIGRFVAGGDDHVFDGPHRLEAGRFCGPGDGRGAGRGGVRTGVGVHESEIHVGSPFRPRRSGGARANRTPLRPFWVPVPVAQRPEPAPKTRPSGRRHRVTPLGRAPHPVPVRWARRAPARTRGRRTRARPPAL